MPDYREADWNPLLFLTCIDAMVSRQFSKAIDVVYDARFYDLI
jgi:hypothetical protein